MLGAIIGDIVGSRFEFIEHSGKDFPLFTSTCHFTDDSLMTLAVAKALYLCAECVAMAVYWARTGKDKAFIRQGLSKYYSRLNDKSFTIENLIGSYGYDELGDWVTCQGSIPQAIIAFLDGDSFEDVIRNAVGIGGDSDTIGAMAGGIAEAYYGIPAEIEDKALSYLPADLQGLCYAFELIKKKRSNA